MKPTLDNYNDTVEQIEEWVENQDSWDATEYSGDRENDEKEYRHSTGGYLQIFPKSRNGDNLVEGVVYRGTDPEENFITYDVDHEYLSDIEVDDPVLEDDLLKRIEVSHEYNPDDVDDMLSSIDEIFTGSDDYSISDITR